MKEIRLTVAGLPPPKDGGNSIFSERHRNHARVVDLLRAAGLAISGTQWNLREEGKVGLELVVVETSGGFRAGGLNLLGGVADVLQARRRGRTYRTSGAWLRSRSSTMIGRSGRRITPLKRGTFLITVSRFGCCEVEEVEGQHRHVCAGLFVLGIPSCDQGLAQSPRSAEL